jgi:hypothetical protein
MSSQFSADSAENCERPQRTGAPASTEGDVAATLLHSDRGETSTEPPAFAWGDVHAPQVGLHVALASTEPPVITEGDLLRLVGQVRPVLGFNRALGLRRE